LKKEEEFEEKIEEREKISIFELKRECKWLQNQYLFPWNFAGLIDNMTSHEGCCNLSLRGGNSDLKKNSNNEQ